MIENIEAAGDAGLPKVKEYPTAFILFCCGFFLIYLIEELVHSIADKSVHNHHHGIFKVQTQWIQFPKGELRVSIWGFESRVKDFLLKVQ